MLKGDRPSDYFLGAILRAYDRERAAHPDSEITPSALWDQICMEAIRQPGGFRGLFAWDHSRAKSVNRIGTIMEVLCRGYVPGLALCQTGKRTIVMETREKDEA